MVWILGDHRRWIDPWFDKLLTPIGAPFEWCYHQHAPVYTQNGDLLLFDNRGRPQSSSVLELDPASLETVWRYRGSAEAPFFSATCGAVERLAHGNTLITESDAGRAFELAPDGEIVWEFYNPHRAGEQDELIATLFEMVRLPADFPVGWVDATPDSAP